VVAYRRLKTKEHFKRLALKVVAVACMRGGCFQEAPNKVIWLGNFWYSGKLVAEGRWLLTRGGRNWKLDHIYSHVHVGDNAQEHAYPERNN